MPSSNWPKEKTYESELQGGKCITHSIEYTITHNCINRCRGCNHFTYITPPHMVDLEEFRRDMTAMAAIAHCDKFSLIGGECLLHPNIVDLLRISNDSGIGDAVSLTTNAQLIGNMSEEFWNALDRIECGLYAGKMTQEQIRYFLARIHEKDLSAFIGLIGEHELSTMVMVKEFCDAAPMTRAWTIGKQFHSTLSHDMSDETESRRKFDRCLYGHVCNTLDQGYVYRCPQAAFVPPLFFGEDRTYDGLPIASLTAESFLQFVASEEPPKSCKKCCALERYFKWEEVPEGTTREEWIRLAEGS